MSLLYLVRCNFVRPDLEAAWNVWYSGPKLAQMLAKPHFISGQRFKASALDDERRYLAVWHVESERAFQTEEYKSDWGFFEWADKIDDWSRDLFEVSEGKALDVLNVHEDEYLYVVSFEGLDRDDAERELATVKAARPGLNWFDAVGLDKASKFVGLKKLTRLDADLKPLPASSRAKENDLRTHIAICQFAFECFGAGPAEMTGVSTPASPEPVSSANRGIMLVITDLPESEEAEIDEWYDKQHVPDRVPGVPGFRLGCRYLALDGGSPKYMAYYETENPDVLRSPAYLHLVQNRDPVTDRILPMFRNTVRTIGTLIAEQSVGFGSHRLIIPITRSQPHDTTLREAIVSKLIPEIARRRGIVRAALIERDETVLTSSASVHARKNDRSFEAVLMVDGTSNATTVSQADLDLIKHAGGVPDSPRLFRMTMLAIGAADIQTG